MIMMISDSACSDVLLILHVCWTGILSIIMVKYKGPAVPGISVMFSYLFFLGKYKGPAFFATLIGPHIFKI